ncbi:response regulator [Tsuneonella mangrovi]|uniref:response regulator n=1 Tax=Tsuneonella mangrovi TaxID=1982042 RepID=UPI000BA2802D|nr:response regulator [Tsuneonella mangrovi]
MSITRELPREQARPLPPLGRILVVEDDPILAMSIELALVDAGASAVVVCRTSGEALAALRAHKPDAIVLDVHLADRSDGWAIAELASSVGPRPPRIVFSTAAPQEIPPDIAQLGPILEKPYEPEQLVEVLRAQRGASGLISRLRKALPHLAG